MATVKIKGIAAVEKQILDTFDKVKSSKQMNNEIGQFVVGRIQLEARRAKPLNDTRDLPELKESTKFIRANLEELNETHPAYRANRSNLTFTGQLIDAVVFEIGRQAIEIFVDATRRRPTKGFSFDRRGFRDLGSLVREGGGNQFATTAIARNVRDQKVKTNAEVDADLRKRGFFMYTARGIRSEPKVLKRINNIVKKFVRRAIKINFES